MEMLNQIAWQGVHVNLQTRCERRLGTHSGTNSALSGYLDRLMEFECIAPQRLIAERIKAKDLASLGHELDCIVSCGIFMGHGIFACRLASNSLHHQPEKNNSGHQEYPAESVR